MQEAMLKKMLKGYLDKMDDEEFEKLAVEVNLFIDKLRKERAK